MLHNISTSAEHEKAFRYTQAAVDIVGSSEHPKNKIAATLFLGDRSVSRTNHWPEKIRERLGKDKKIGNSSGTIHAETACILAADFPTEGACICITDPFCPNCAKNMAEAGIKRIYIDHKGFDKDFFQRRGAQFNNMAMQICEHAGISVYKINRHEKTVEPILEIPEDYTPPEDSPIIPEEVETASEATFKAVIEKAAAKNKRRKFCVCLARERGERGELGKIFALVARAHVVTGYSMQDPDEALELLTPIGKYNFIQEPVNRMMMYSSKKGLCIIDGYLYCSQVPTSREQVNMVGAGIERITIGDIMKSRDCNGFAAMKTLKDAHILDYT